MVTVLCPHFVRTRIVESGRNRQPRYGEAPVRDPGSPAANLFVEIAKGIEAGLEPTEVAAQVLFAICDNELYVFMHSNMREGRCSPLAGIWTTFNGDRGAKSKPVPGPHQVYGFLTTAPNAAVEPIHPKAKPVILTADEERDVRMRAPRG